MNLIVRTFNHRIITISVDDSNDINDVKNMIEDIEFIPAAHLRLESNGTIVESGMATTLFTDGDLIDLAYEVCCGMRAKWRKKRIRRLKRIRRRRRLRNR